MDQSLKPWTGAWANAEVVKSTLVAALVCVAFWDDVQSPLTAVTGVLFLVPILASLGLRRRSALQVTVIASTLLLFAKCALVHTTPFELGRLLFHRCLGATLLCSVAAAAAALRRSARDTVRAEAEAAEARTAMLALRAALARTEAAEHELRSRHELHEAMAGMSHIGGWQLEVSTQTPQWSSEVYRIHETEPGHEMSLDEAIGFYPPDVRPQVTEAVRRALEEGTPFDMVLPLVTAKGNRRWVRAVGSAEREDGVVKRVSGALQDVTEAHEIQNRLARASRGSAEGHWEFDFTTNSAWLSASFQELLAKEAVDYTCTREEFWQLLSPEDVDRVQRVLSRHIATGAPYDVELRMRSQGGGTRWFRSRATAELGPNGQPLRVGGSIIAIDAEKAAREELEALRERHERALKGTQDGVWDWNLKTQEVWLSGRLREMLGYHALDTLGLPDTADTIRGITHPDDLPRLQAATREHLEARAPYDEEIRFQMRDGSYRWFRTRGSAERDHSGTPTAFAGSLQDIEEDKKAEFERSAARKRVARAVDGSSDALFEVDLKNRGPTWYSPRLREMLGYAPEDPFPDSILSFLAPQDRAAIEEFGAVKSRDNLPSERIFQLPTKEGGKRWFRARWRSEHDAQGKVSRLSGSFQDITEQREAQAAMQAATAAAAAANRAKGEFLANMSHEIRTPLNGVLGMTELLLEGQLNSEQQEYAETIRSSGLALLAIINDILDLSKIDAGKLTLERIPLDPRESVRQTTMLLEPQARKRGLQLLTEVDPAVPHRVRGDPLRLQQILLNLAGNALKFTHLGGVRIVVTLVERVALSAVLKFEIHDTGIGIAIEDLGQLFSPFIQADSSTSRHYGGTGLGLSIVKRLLEQLGGVITVSSELGHGSCFAFTWPCEVLDTADAEPEVGSVSTVAPRAFRARVLLVEDHPVNQQVARRQLERMGCSVIIAENGARGAELAATDPYDLILMDVQMPILDGLAATRLIRARETAGSRVPIIAITASAMTDERDACLKAGMDDLLSKPIDRARLQAVLTRYLPAQPDALAHSVIDEAHVQALMTEDHEFASALTATFIDSTREILLAVEAAVIRPDRPALGSLGHKLLGAARSAGASELALLARRLEQEAPAATSEGLASLSAELQRAYHATIESLGRLGLIERVA